MEKFESTAMMDEWRNYLRTANTDIYEIIKKAITVAASDHPTEFQTKRDKIAEMLFSVNLQTLDQTKKVSKVLKIKRISRETEDETSTITEGIPNVTTENKVNIDEGTKFYGQGVAEVFKIKEILEKSGTHESVMCDWLTKLQDMDLSINTLDTTGIGKTVSALKKHGSKDVSQIATTLIKRWKDMVKEYWRINKESSVLKTLSEQRKSTVTPYQQTKETETVQHKPDTTKRKLPIRKETTAMLQRQKPLNSQNMDAVKKQSVVVRPKKPPPVTVETRLQNPTNSTIPRNLEDQKLESTKRKLREGYEREDNKKRQRKTQVIEVHDLLRQGLVPKFQDNKCRRRSSFSRLVRTAR